VAEHRRALEALALRRLPLATGVFLAFLAGALPIELYFYPDRLPAYLFVFAVEVAVSWAAWVAARRWGDHGRAIAAVWGSALGLCICAYYPIVAGDATLAAAALICIIAGMPAMLPFGLRHQLVLGTTCALGILGLVAWGLRSSLPWPYMFIALVSVTVATSIGAQTQTQARWEAAERQASLEHAYGHLRTALARAESAVAMRSRLVANVSHELRTPINVIIGYADVLIDVGAAAGPEITDAATRIRYNAVALEALVSQLLDLSRLSSGKVDLAIEDVDVPVLLDDVAERTRFQLGGKPVAVTVDCTVDRCPADRLRLEQILTNLAGNAAKFTSRGRFDIVARRSPEGYVFEVADTGCGIPADRQETVFDAFEQVVPGVHSVGGIGLGLAIVRQLVDLLGGTVRLASEVGVGSRFTVLLPVLRRGQRPAGVAAAPDATAA